MINIPHPSLNFFKVLSFFCLAFFFSNTSIIAQAQIRDNWKKELTKAKGQERVELLLKLSKDLAKENLSIAHSLATEGIALAKEIGDSLSMHRIGINLGEIYITLEDLDKGIEYTQKSLNYFDSKKESTLDKAKSQLVLAKLYIGKRIFNSADSLISESESYFNKRKHLYWESELLYSRGHLSLRQQKLDLALDYFSKGLEISKQSEDIDQVSLLMIWKALVTNLLGNYPTALELQLKAINMNGSTLTKSVGYSHLGQTYRVLEDWDTATKHLKTAIKLQKVVGLKCKIADNYYNLGIISKNQLNYGEALKYLETSYTIKKECNSNLIKILGSLGNLYNKLGKTDKVNECYDKRLILAQNQNNWDEIWSVYYNRGSNAHNAKRYKEGLKYALKSYEIAKEKNRLHFLMRSNNLLYAIYSRTGDDKWLYHEEQYRMFKDSLVGLEKIKKIGALEQKYHAQEQQDSMNTIRAKDQQLNEGRRFATWLKVLLGGSFLALILFIFFIKKQKRELASVKQNFEDQTKMDQYFEKLFARLDQNLPISEKENTHSHKSKPINDMASFLSSNLSTDSDWKSFEMYFEKVHKDFFKILKTKYPAITPNELNMCALLKLNIPNKDIAQILGISYDSVRKSQSLLYKKLELTSAKNLREFILKV